jgi:hypothetical protein
MNGILVRERKRKWEEGEEGEGEAKNEEDAARINCQILQ